MRKLRKALSGLGFHNNKGNFIVDGVFIVVLLFVVAIMFVVMRPVLSDMNKVAINFGGDLQSNLGVQSSKVDNMTGVIQDMEDNQTNWFDWAFLLIFAAMIIALWFSVWYIDTHPVYFIIIFVLLIAVTMIGMAFANAFEDMMTDTTLGASASQFVIIPFIMQNIVVISAAIIIITGVILYAKIKQ